MQSSNSRIGHYLKVTTTDESFKAFVPPPLPPHPPLNLTAILPKYELALQALGQLDGMAILLPNIELFLYHYIRKEALLSSQIEGTQSSFADLMLHELAEAPGVPISDVEEVSAYVAAIKFGVKRLKEGLPLSLRLLKEMHAHLLATGRGRHQQPGTFRRSQNWIGGTRPGNATFVPPPSSMLMECLDSLEKFLHEKESGLPELLKAGLVHVQFETIHPFLDGNGRLGRLLITLMLYQAKLLKEPILYLSLYFKTHRSEYYRLLTEVREQGAWETWLEFFLDGITETAKAAVETANRILHLLNKDGAKITKLGRAAKNAAKAHLWLQTHPLTSIQAIAKALDVTQVTAEKAVQHLVSLGILKEITGRQRDRLFCYKNYLSILSEGTEPLKTFKS